MFKEEIKELNPGRKIELHKICPYLKEVCIKDKCNAYVEHTETTIVTLEDKIAHENKEFDWESNLARRGWLFNCGSKSNIGPDNQNSLYIKTQDKLYYGRCLI